MVDWKCFWRRSGCVFDSFPFHTFQEAFKAVEDIHYLMSLSKRPPKPQTLANFHTKLSLVFWKADSMLFHACARHKLFRLTKDMKKNPSMDDLTRLVVGITLYHLICIGFWLVFLTIFPITATSVIYLDFYESYPQGPVILTHCKIHKKNKVYYKFCHFSCI